MIICIYSVAEPRDSNTLTEPEQMLVSSPALSSGSLRKRVTDYHSVSVARWVVPYPYRPLFSGGKAARQSKGWQQGCCDFLCRAGKTPGNQVIARSTLSLSVLAFPPQIYLFACGGGAPNSTALRSLLLEMCPWRSWESLR